MKILYDSKNHTIRELKEGSKPHKMSRLENDIFKYFANNEFMTALELESLTESDNFWDIYNTMRKLKKLLNIEHKKYMGYRLEDDIWII